MSEDNLDLEDIYGPDIDDLTDCPIPAENEAADTAQRWNEQRGG